MSIKVRWLAALTLGLSLVLAVPALADAASGLTLWGEEPYGGQDFRFVIGGTAGQGEITSLAIACPLGDGTWLECYLLKEGAFSLCLANNQVFAGGIHLEAVMGNQLLDGAPAIMVGIAEETHPATYLWAFIRYYPFVYDVENWELLTSSTWSAGIRMGTPRLGLVLGGRDGFGSREWFVRVEASLIRGSLLIFGYDGSHDLQVAFGLSL